MIIQPIAPINVSSITPITSPSVADTSSARGGFFEGVLGQAVNHLAGSQQNADSQAVKLATGQNVNLVDSVLAMEQTSLDFKFAMQVRDKVIEAYQDVMRMQM